MINSITQLCLGFILAMLADLGYSWFTEGYGLNPILCIATAIAVLICSICSTKYNA